MKLLDTVREIETEGSHDIPALTLSGLIAAAARAARECVEPTSTTLASMPAFL
jgi:hypothetical protein